jgi:hypothetical protein
MLVVAALAGAHLAGCGSEAPRNPPQAEAPPPPPPPPPPLSEEQVARAFEPFFFVLFGNAFQPTDVEATSRMRWLNESARNILDGVTASNRAADLLAWQESSRDARAATPQLSDVISRMAESPDTSRRNTATWIRAWDAILWEVTLSRIGRLNASDLAVFEALSAGNQNLLPWLRITGPQVNSISDQAESYDPASYGADPGNSNSANQRTIDEPVSPLEAVLTMYLFQAIRDADTGNLHRAHVLFSDISAILDDDTVNSDREYLRNFALFFTEVPDAARYERTARLLERYMVRQEEQIILRGEHASALKAAGLTDAANFMRNSLLTRFNLVTLPMIDAAISRGESYGFRAPAQFESVRQRVLKLASDIRPSAGEFAEDEFRRQAVLIPADPDYRDTMTRFETMWAAGGEQAELATDSAEGSVERVVNSLWASQRPFQDWLVEKSLCSRHAPLFLVKPPLDDQWLGLAVPHVADDTLSGSWRDVAARATDVQSNGVKALLEWCRGGSLDDEERDGTGYFLLAWFWRELDRPDLARQALLIGAQDLLLRARSGEIDQLRLDGNGNRRKMFALLRHELNGYRLLAAAAQLADSPPGAVVSGRDSYVPEIDVLLSGWRQSWLKCGFQAEDADGAIDSIRSRTQVSAKPRTVPDRYHFFDYRFAHGFVPDVVAEAAVEAQLFAPPDGIIKGGEMVRFINRYRRPRQLSPGARKRWADGGQGGQRPVGANAS